MGTSPPWENLGHILSENVIKGELGKPPGFSTSSFVCQYQGCGAGGIKRIGEVLDYETQCFGDEGAEDLCLPAWVQHRVTVA